MKLSVIIVNYNVEHFLEQCLIAVKSAIKDIEAEVIVVDNNSVDGSVKMLNAKFPWVTCIINTENVGFSRANNQAIRQACGKYILLLNPDTIIEDDTLSKTIAFMDAHSEAGALGVKMVDGKGAFLPESKRGLPTPEVAFYKIFGISKLFSKSKRFGKYHLTYLNKDQTNQVDVLSGAFMLVRNETIQKIGLLDEDYFMYGEDIDWSYRITKAGYKNYYFADTTIIHYKGESTKKGSLNYVFVFYNAMRIFAQKHFSGKNRRFFILMINFAIYFRALLSVSKRLFNRVWMPVLDFVTIYGAMFFLKNWWEDVLLFQKTSHFPDEFIQIAVPIYILIWIFGIYLANGYAKNSKPSKITKGIIGGTIVILLFYALLPEYYRYSRAMIVIGAATFISISVFWRMLLNRIGWIKFSFGDNASARFIVVGEHEEGQRVIDILRKTNLNPDFIGLITPQKDKESLGDLSQIAEIVLIYHISEIIFCAKDLSSNQIIALMTKLHASQLEFKIAPSGSLSIIGSNSINRAGDIYVIDINVITDVKNKRNKRIFDFVTALAMLIASPMLIWFSNPLGYFKNCGLVIFGKRSWIGLDPSVDIKISSLKPGILFPSDGLKTIVLNSELIEKANQVYASDYNVENDINILLKSISKIGRKS